ncbi:hypothetical protein ACO34A_16310 [Rhizobium sp. ACO-34A]|nr:hypothetical protein ACO34A_16310 [Rhizobium sp. ACO-34A]
MMPKYSAEDMMQSVNFNYGGHNFQLYTHNHPDHLFNVITAEKSFYELDLLVKAKEVYTPGSVIVDIGANIGNHTVFFTKVLNAPVLAFEPFDKNREILMENLRINDCTDFVRIESLALGDFQGRGRAVVPTTANYGMVNIQPDPNGDIQIARLDDYITAQTPLSIVKMDVEGGELGVLRGATETLRRQKPHLFIEAGELAYFMEIQKYLADFGYQVRGRYCHTATYHFSV